MICDMIIHDYGTHDYVTWYDDVLSTLYTHDIYMIVIQWCAVHPVHILSYTWVVMQWCAVHPTWHESWCDHVLSTLYDSCMPWLRWHRRGRREGLKREQESSPGKLACVCRSMVLVWWLSIPSVHPSQMMTVHTWHMMCCPVCPHVYLGNVGPCYCFGYSWGKVSIYFSYEN